MKSQMAVLTILVKTLIKVQNAPEFSSRVAGWLLYEMKTRSLKLVP